MNDTVKSLLSVNSRSWMRFCKSGKRNTSKTSTTYTKCTTPRAAPDDTKMLTLVETETDEWIEILVRDTQKLHRGFLLNFALKSYHVQLPQ